MPALIWVVDDSPLDLKHAERVLREDFDVRCFPGGSAVLEQLATQLPPDVIVLDWMMPDVSGIEVIQFMRGSAGRLPVVPVLLLTARTEPEQIAEGIDAGANDYLGKPFADEELRARVGSLVRTSRLLERAQRAEATVRSLLASAPDALLVVDAQGKITYVNAEAERVFAGPAASLLGRGIRDLVGSFPHRNISVAPDTPLLPLPDVEIRGRIYSPSVRLLPSDTAANTTVALRDVTDRRRMEARRTDFYSIIAHDLRSPLHAMSLRLQLMLDGRRGPLSAELVSDMRKCEGSIRAMMRMINDFLDLAKMEGVGYKIDRTPVDLSAVVSAIVEDVGPLAEASGIELRWSSPGERVVIGDLFRLSQAVSNLVGNALKYTPPDGTVEVRVADVDGSYEVSVRDTGPGIPADAAPTIFDRFTRVPETARAAPGWGLGLMIVREIVEAHGGRVGLRSELGSGSTFWFTVPKSEHGQEAA